MRFLIEYRPPVPPTHAPTARPTPRLITPDSRYRPVQTKTQKNIFDDENFVFFRPSTIKTRKLMNCHNIGNYHSLFQVIRLYRTSTIAKWFFFKQSKKYTYIYILCYKELNNSLIKCDCL